MHTHGTDPAATLSITLLPVTSGKKAKGSRDTCEIAAMSAKGQDPGVKWDNLN